MANYIRYHCFVCPYVFQLAHPYEACKLDIKEKLLQNKIYPRWQIKPSAAIYLLP